MLKIRTAHNVAMFDVGFAYTLGEFGHVAGFGLMKQHECCQNKSCSAYPWSIDNFHLLKRMNGYDASKEKLFENCMNAFQSPDPVSSL